VQHQLELLKKYDIRVRGVRGQHFLIDPNIQRKLIESLSIQPKDTLIEIGPGLGALTEGLAAEGTSVIAIDSDRRFVEILSKELQPQHPHLQLKHADILKLALDELAPANVKLKVIGNLPYYITSPVIFHLIQYRHVISEAVLMVQKEIAERLVAPPGSKHYGRLSVSTAYFANLTRLFNVSRFCFTPKPRVESSVIKLEFKTTKPDLDESLLLAIIKGAFAHRRKNVLNSLSGELKGRFSKEHLEKVFDAINLDTKKRAEMLALTDYERLCQSLSLQ